MCCFSQRIVSVSNTNLFARLSGKGSQFLVYQMQFQSEVANAMILPLPVALPAREDAVRFVSFEGYDYFFDDLNSGFPVENLTNRSNSKFVVDSALPAALKVHEVGNFVASFVPSQSDFDRLDPQFVIPKESWAKLPEYKDYGFAVFQLKELKGKPHPMAFEFPTRWPDQLFFPTVHIHDGEVHEYEEFDHQLYVQDAAFDQNAGQYRGAKQINAKTGMVRSKWRASQFLKPVLANGFLAPELLVHRMELRGNHPNKDTIKPTAPALVSQMDRPDSVLPDSPRKFWYLGPGAVAFAGLGWLIGRRNKRRMQKNDR